MSSSAPRPRADETGTSVDWAAFYDEINAQHETPQSRGSLETMLQIKINSIDNSEDALAVIDAAVAADELEKVGRSGYVLPGDSDSEEESNKNVGNVGETSETEKPNPEEMEREALEEEVYQLRERVGGLEDDMEFVMEQMWQLQDVVSGEMDMGVAESIAEDDGGVMERLDHIESGDVSNNTVDRSRMLPAHQMWEQYKTTGGDGMGKTQRRTGVLFGEFVTTVTGDEKTAIDASGQLFKMNTAGAVQALEDVDELEDVKEESKSTLAARVMRNVHGMTKTEDCECDTADACSHTMIDFRSGKPHVLAVPKQQFVAAMKNAYGAGDGVDGDATTNDPSEQDGEDLADDEIGIDELTNADTEADR